ncbi:aspartyl-phosphate phosphatase Spo0E family protein [Saccharibacillus sp. O23]|uniref:aspartyl-phosphate phosphatase Spo0E family protein n=1 Tax=Saccharibacillus sp. O23 TaxID=2009338 RepID=UPI00211B441A|nr:aspartyl-phosphate phosphatase Spo0E family protein [Saccharibacillus sp. O23]
MSAASFLMTGHESGSARFRPQHAVQVPAAMAERELFLQEEIRLLRAQMEETFRREQSFTAAAVVEISSRLDLKINEYMQLAR